MAHGRPVPVTIAPMKKTFLSALIALITCLHSGALSAAPVVRQVGGANPAAIQTMVTQFRTDLGGANNGVGGSFLTGRREINWDGVPDTSAEPNDLPPNFFNVNSPRGIVFHTIAEEPGSALNRFAVSADSSNPTATAVRFGNIRAEYSTQFQTFTAERLFIARNSTNIGVSFFVPGTTIPATVSGFGVIFADVDSSSGGGRSVIRCFGVDGAQLSAASAPVADNGLSFVGISFNAGERVARVLIEVGTAALAAATAEAVGTDLVAMDDFIYGEPQPLDFTDASVSVSVGVPLRVPSISITGSTPPGFVDVSLQCSPTHNIRIFSSTDLLTWHPAALEGAVVGPNQNLLVPRANGTWVPSTKVVPIRLSKEGQPKLFYRVVDEVTGDVTCVQTP